MLNINNKAASRFALKLKLNTANPTASYLSAQQLAFMGLIKARSARCECVTVNWSLGCDSRSTGFNNWWQNCQKKCTKCSLRGEYFMIRFSLTSAADSGLGISRRGRHLSSKHQRSFDEDVLWWWTAVLVTSSRAEVKIPSNSSDPGSVLNVCFHLVLILLQMLTFQLKASEAFPWRPDQSWTQQLPCEWAHFYWSVVTEEIVGILNVNLGRFSVFYALIEHLQHTLTQTEREQMCL